MSEITIPDKLEPLFNIPKGVDTFILTGGRYSFKSYTAAIAACNWAAIDEHRILYARWTNISSKDSTFPEVQEKIELLGYDDYFNITTNRIDGVHNKSKIVFKGFKTGALLQTANLKSLKDFSCMIVDEAEEIPDYDTYEKTALSIRGNDKQSGKPNIKVLILNPATKVHWIFKEFFENKGVEPGFNGVKDNICYIHSSYLDMPEVIPDNIIRDFENMRINKPQRYNHIVLGGWLDKAEGVIFEDWEMGDFDEYLPHIYCMDFGYTTDPTTLVKIATTKEVIYTKLYLYKTGLSTQNIADILEDRLSKSELIIAESAEPRLIDELWALGFNIVKCKKGPDSVRNGLAKMTAKKIICDPDDIESHKELNNYVWMDKKSNTPVDKWNHYIDAVRYGHEELSKEDEIWFG